MNGFFAALLLLVACGGSTVEPDKEEVKQAAPAFRFPYDLETPDRTYKLPRKLEEISGLSLTADEQQLVAVQDENGIVFFIDVASGAVEEEIEFWKDGDYEGVEVVGGDVYVAKSTGTLYRILRIGEDDQEVEKYNYFLSGENDVEGLAYDRGHHRLLLACKAQAGESDEFRLRKAIYAFDLRAFRLEEKPAYTISLEDVQDYLGTSPAIRKLTKLMEFFQPGQSEFSFSPSGLAVHPLTGHIYITSSVGKMLVVLDPNGRVVHIEKMSKEIHEQPEGICFDRTGRLYISNEGKNGDGRIYRFDYRP